MTFPDVERLTADLVAVDSVSDRSTAPVAGVVADLLRGLGAHVRLQEVARGAVTQVNVLGRLGEGEGGLLLGGHLDTVPYLDGQRATTRAFREGGDLFGRGTCDMKGGIAAALVAAAAERDRGPLRRPLWFCFTFEEEVGCHGARFARALDWLGAEHALVAEPTELAPVREHKGYRVGEVVVRGRAGHSSDPDAAASAVEGATRVLQALYALRDRLALGPPGDGLVHPPWTTLNVGRISGGTAPNVVAESCRFTVELRPRPGEDAEVLAAALEEAVAEARRVKGVEASFEPGHDLDAFTSPADTPLVRFVESFTGRPAAGAPFATEAPIYASTGARVVVCGPGSVRHAHREDERVAVDELHRAVQLYRAAVDTFCR